MKRKYSKYNYDFADCVDHLQETVKYFGKEAHW